MSADKYRRLLQKLLTVTSHFATGQNMGRSAFAEVLEGTFRRDYVAALAIQRLSKESGGLISPFGESCMALTRRLVEDFVSIEYMLFKGKEEQTAKFMAFKDVESKRDLEYLRSVGMLPSKEAETIIEGSYVKSRDTYFNSEKDLIKRRSWAGKGIEKMVAELADAGLLSPLEKLSIAHMYQTTSGRVHFSPSEVLEYLHLELFINSNQHNLYLSMFIATIALSKLAMRFISEIKVDEETHKAVTEVWQEVGQAKPPELKS